MSGLLQANGGIALNSSTAQNTNLQYILGIKAFADGGNIQWSGIGDVSVGHATKADSATTATTATTANKVANALSVNGKSYNGSAAVTVGTIGIGYGGTGATTAAAARGNLLYLAPSITTTTDDTTAKWGALGPGTISFYSTKSQLTDQPSQYGLVLNLNNKGAEVHQMWFTQASGDVYHRGGNSGGWSGTWRKFLDSSNYNTYSPTLTGTGASGTWGISISGNAATATSATSATKATQDGSGNTITSTYLKLSGGTMTGKISSSYASGTWINSANGSSAFNVTGTTYTGWISGNTKNGKMVISTYPSSTDLLYFGYMSNTRISEGTNSFEKQMTWDGTTGTLTTATFKGALDGNANTATSATSATTASKLGTSTVGGTSTPIYLKAGVATACDKPASGSWFKGVVGVGSDGVAEYGRYIDFHYTSASTNDYDVRIDCAGNSKNILYLPAVTGQVVIHTNDTAIGNATQPVYIAASGAATACTAYSGLLTAFSSSTNTLSLTVGGTTKTTTAVNSVSNTWTGGTTAGPTIKTTVNGKAGSAVAIPSASGSASGVVTTGAQTFAGKKTFTTSPLIDVSSNPYVQLYDGTTNWYCQAYTNHMSIGATYANALKVDASGNTYIPGKLTMTGNIAFDNGDYTNYDMIKFHTGDNNGAGISIGGGGLVVIGAGKSAANLISADSLSGSSENVYIASDNNIYFRTNCQTIANRTTSCYINTSGVLYGACWNDYAEYRQQKEKEQPVPYGRVVVENNDDTLSLSTERLMPGGNICSDTFGFAIGETDNAKMPIAVSGRVLVYTNEDRYSYNAGDAVCTGPNGTVSKMTREEIKEYPDRIIGYVSAIPNYETWGENDIAVDGRIWVKVV